MVNFSLTPDQVREIDREATERYAIPSLILMENAGRGCVDLLERLRIAGPVVIACGKGNNGGDGLVMARHLLVRGYQVRLILVGTRHSPPPDAAANLAIVDRLPIPKLELDADSDLQRCEPFLVDADWIVDALLGIGARGNPRPPLANLLERLNACRGRKLAVDVPSGLDALTGVPGSPTFRADHTCTFVARKTGFSHPQALEYLGQLHLADIGAPVAGSTSSQGQVPE